MQLAGSHMGSFILLVMGIQAAALALAMQLGMLEVTPKQQACVAVLSFATAAVLAALGC